MKKYLLLIISVLLFLSGCNNNEKTFNGIIEFECLYEVRESTVIAKDIVYNNNRISVNFDWNHSNPDYIPIREEFDDYNGTAIEFFEEMEERYESSGLKLKCTIDITNK